MPRGFLKAGREGKIMNIHSIEIERAPTREDAERALRLLRSWAGAVSRDEIQTLDPMVNRLVPGQEMQAYPALSRAYPQEFRVDDAYLPDLQNGPESLIKGARRQIQHVGISNFRLPIRFHTRDAAT
jgi:GTP cyclohydrolase IB